VVKGNRNETRADVVSCSVQTLAGERRRQMLVDVSLVIIDECHRAAAKSYLDILRHYGCYEANGQGAHAAGFTATMVRGDDKALGDVWQEIVHTKDIASLVQEGFLVRPRGLRVRVEDLDLSKVKRSGGDYQADALGEALEQSLAPEAIAKAMREHAADRRTVLFAPRAAPGRGGLAHRKGADRL
jgi:superfamily II DNA or RNA helicase